MNIEPKFFKIFENHRTFKSYMKPRNSLWVNTGDHSHRDAGA